MHNDIEFVAYGVGDSAPPAVFHGPLLVQCQSRRCLAYYGRDGKWRNFVNGDELPDFVRMVDED